MDLYHQRNTNLRAIGYRSYAKYLKSLLWRSIKKRVLRYRGLVCVRCAEEGNQIHHVDYDTDTLLGNRLGGMVVVCRECHEWIEHEHGVKVSPERANERLGYTQDVSDAF